MNKPDIIESTIDFFGNKTPLADIANFGNIKYEQRPQQKEMAIKVAESLKSGKHLCVEAPTGVGKSFAYLIPACFYAHFYKKQVLVSTHTISLQEQLIEKDIKMLSSMLPFKIKSVLVKGRENYVCMRRLYAIHQNPDEMLFSDDEFTNEIHSIVTGLEEGTVISKSDMNPLVSHRTWSAVNCEVGNCLKKKCSFFDDCVFQKERNKLWTADIIVTNHSLFFTDLSMKYSLNADKFEPEAQEGLLPNYSTAIIDEGHTIEDSASSHLGLRVSSSAFLYYLRRLYNPKTKKGLFAKSADIVFIVKDTIKTSETFFYQIYNWVLKQNTNPLRYNVAGHIPNMLSQKLSTLDRILVENMSIEKDESNKKNIKMLRESILEIGIQLQEFLMMERADHVYWFDISAKNQNVTMTAVPIEVKHILKKILFNSTFTTVVTSATLAVKNKLNYFLERVGGGVAEHAILSSPFNFQEQVEIFIPFEMPPPKDTDAFLPKVEEHIKHFISQTGGKTFVLFTSFDALNKLADKLESFFNKLNIRLLVQGREFSRKNMLDKFKNDINSVIFGTSSFWTGVDVPGEALSSVIIVKLPFSTPTHPLNQARYEYLEKSRKNPFLDYSLPEAILKFRQGFGRLIRSKKDHGIVVILDSRIIKASYGKNFLDSIPNCKKTFC